MKEIKRSKKTSAFKKIFIKLCRLFGYELIDQSTLTFPTQDKSNINQLSYAGKSSFSLGLGETKISRKVKGIDIFVKTCTSVQLVSQNKKRIFEKNKSEYTFRTIRSLIERNTHSPNVTIFCTIQYFFSQSLGATVKTARRRSK